MAENRTTQPPWMKWLRLGGLMIGPAGIVWGATRVADGRVGTGVFFLIIGVLNTLLSIAPRSVPQLDPARPPNPVVLGAALGFGAVALVALVLVLNSIL